MSNISDDSSSDISDGYIYLIIEREFLNKQASVFKFGYTSNILQRFAGYPKGSKLLLTLCVYDAHGLEKAILKALRENFIQRTDIGREYFEGDVNKIIALILRFAPSDCLNLFKSTVDRTSVDPGISDESDIDTPITMEYTSPAVTDADVIISRFVNSHKDLIGPNLTKSSLVYAAYVIWTASNKDEIKRTLTHRRLTTGLKELFGAVTKVHRFDDGPAQAVFLPDQIQTIICPEVAIATFFEAHCCQISGPVKTLDLFKIFSGSEYSVAVPMSTFVKIIKTLFGITVKMHAFPEGSCQAMLFTDNVDNVDYTELLDEHVRVTSEHSGMSKVLENLPPSMSNWIATRVTVTGVRSDFVLLSNLKEAFENDMSLRKLVSITPKVFVRLAKVFFSTCEGATVPKTDTYSVKVDGKFVTKRNVVLGVVMAS